MLSGAQTAKTKAKPKHPASSAPTNAPSTAAMDISESYKKLLHDAQQALVVTTSGWNAVDGKLLRFEKHEGQWKPAGEPIPIVVGKNGLAWDALQEFAPPKSEPVKHEGDGRSPAGVFAISELFGFDSTPEWARLPYRQLTTTIECVDDPNSAQYGQVVDRSVFPNPTWESSEKMREVDAYKIGAVVAYNNEIAVPGSGSCIFLHIWKGTGHGTAGCTAMEEAKLEDVLMWLDAGKNPVVIQFPESVYEKYRAAWSLP